MRQAEESRGRQVPPQLAEGADEGCVEDVAAALPPKSPERTRRARQEGEEVV